MQCVAEYCVATDGHIKDGLNCIAWEIQKTTMPEVGTEHEGVKAGFSLPRSSFFL